MLEDAIQAIAHTAKDLNGFVVVIIGLWLLYTGKVVLGRELDAQKEENEIVKKDRDFWRSVSFSALKISEHFTDTTAKALIPPSEKGD